MGLDYIKILESFKALMDTYILPIYPHIQYIDIVNMNSLTHSSVIPSTLFLPFLFSLLKFCVFLLFSWEKLYFF